MNCAHVDASAVCGRPQYAHAHGDLGHPFERPTSGKRWKPRTLSQARTGGGNPNSILTEAQAVEVLCSRVPARVFALRFGVDASTIRRVRQGRSWSHLNPDGMLWRKGGRDGSGMRQRVRAKRLPEGAPRLKRPSEM